MSQQTRATLKKYFEKNDTPTQGQFSDLIDSCINIIDNGMVGVLYPKEQWETNTDYVKGDIVYDAGNSYLCKIDHTSTGLYPELDPTNWMKLVAKGDKGDKGDTGSDGIPATVEVGTVTTLPYPSQATVVNVGTTENAIFDFGIPKGEDGTGTGDVKGPASAIDGNVVLFDTSTGKLLKDSGLKLTGSNTGDQDLSPYALLSGAAFSGAISALNLAGSNTGDQDLSGLIPKSIGSAEGDLITFSDVATPMQVPKGLPDQVLTMKTDGTLPEWRKPASGADVLQVQIFS